MRIIIAMTILLFAITFTAIIALARPLGADSRGLSDHADSLDGLWSR